LREREQINTRAESHCCKDDCREPARRAGSRASPTKYDHQNKDYEDWSKRKQPIHNG
jgi:hypothetical protein